MSACKDKLIQAYQDAETGTILMENAPEGTKQYRRGAQMRRAAQRKIRTLLEKQKLCEGRSVNLADPPSTLCPGCQAYKDQWMCHGQPNNPLSKQGRKAVMKRME